MHLGMQNIAYFEFSSCFCSIGCYPLSSHSILLMDQWLTLLIHVQNSWAVEGSKTGGKGLKSISNELASAINDGLYFYEQVEMPIVSLLIFITSITYLHCYY